MNDTPSHKPTRTTLLAQFALLSALVVFMGLTPFGYPKIGLVEITLLMIPVALGAIRLGPVAGGLLGALFGLTSFAQCFGLSLFGTTLLGINPVATFVLCMVPRIAMGIFVALIYRGLARDRVRDVRALSGAFLSSALINTALFVVLLFVLFGSSDYIQGMRGAASLLSFAATLIGINGIFEAVVATVVGTPIAAALSLALDGRAHH